MSKKKKEKPIVIFGQETSVDEYGVIDWSRVKIPDLKIPEGSSITDLIVDVPPSAEDMVRLEILE